MDTGRQETFDDYEDQSSHGSNYQFDQETNDTAQQSHFGNHQRESGMSANYSGDTEDSRPSEHRGRGSGGQRYCHFYNRNGCTRPKCEFVHDIAPACRRYMNGRCTRRFCGFSHPRKPNEAEEEREILGTQNFQNRRPIHPGETKTQPRTFRPPEPNNLQPTRRTGRINLQEKRAQPEQNRNENKQRRSIITSTSFHAQDRGQTQRMGPQWNYPPSRTQREEFQEEY